MKKNYITWLIAASALAMIALISIQVRWMLKSRNLLEEQFTNRVSMALCSTVERLATDVTQSSEIRACCAAPENAACIAFESQLQDTAIQASLNQWLRFYKIDLPYTVQITPKDIAGAAPPPVYSCSLGPVLESDTHYLQVNFEGKEAYVTHHLGLMVLASIAILLFICAIFGMATWQLLRQKRMADRNRDFFNQMTHEFRTPLTNIRLAANLMLRKDETLANNQYLDIIRLECNQLVHQVENVLQFGSLEKESYQLEQQPIDLRRLTEDVLGSMDLQIRELGARVTMGSNSSGCNIQGDAFHLGNAFRNIIDNALKYSGDTPQINIAMSADATGTRMSFTDNGIGLSERDQQKIFEKFQRGDAAADSGKKGFGLGLAYVKKIVEMHHGQISVANSNGHGTRFELFFPKET